MLGNQQLIQKAPYLFWGLVLIVTALLLVELAPSHSGWPYKDKVEHMVAFAALGIFGHLSYPRKSNWVYSGLASLWLINGMDARCIYTNAHSQRLRLGGGYCRRAVVSACNLLAYKK